MFDVHEPRPVMAALATCRGGQPDLYIKLNAYDARLGRQTTALSFIVQRPSQEPGFRLDRQEGTDRQGHDSLHADPTDRPHSGHPGPCHAPPAVPTSWSIYPPCTPTLPYRHCR